MSRVLLIVLIFSPCLIFSQEFYPQALNLGIDGEYGAITFEGAGGISCADFNNDGYDELSFSTGVGDELIFYENKKSHFELVNPPFVANTLETKQIIWVDYDDDNDKDLFITAYDGPNYLYENDGNLNFTEVTLARGLPLNNDQSFGANFGDLDMDGDLDLYITNYGQPNPQENVMYAYDSNTKMYNDITTSSGTGNGNRQSFCSAFFDFDNDGDLDIYISNDRQQYENTLYMNLGNMTFVDVSVPSNTNIGIFSMNAGIGDPDMDGDFDIYATNIGPSSYLENQGNLTYQEVAGTNGTQFNRTGWGGNFFDWDNNRYEDLYVCYQAALASKKVNAFYVNNQNASFSEPFYNSKGLAGVDTIGSYCNAILDFNNDGRLDIIVNRVQGEKFELFANHENTSNNFIKLELNAKLNYGSGAMIETVVNGISSYVYKHATIAYLAQNSDYVNIGIGTANSIDQLIVHWSNGDIESINGVDIAVNTLNTIKEGQGVSAQKSLEVCKFNHDIVLNPIPSQVYSASNVLTSNTLVKNFSDVHFKANVELELNVGFEVEQGAIFHAEINGCSN